MKLHEISGDDWTRQYNAERAYKEKHAALIGSAGFKNDGYAFSQDYMSDEEWLEDNEITTRVEGHMHTFVKWLVDSFHIEPRNVDFYMCSTVNGVYRFTIELSGRRFQKEDDLTVELMVKTIPAKIKQLVPEIGLSELHVHRTQKKITISARPHTAQGQGNALWDRWLKGVYHYDPEKLTAERLATHNEHKRKAYGEMMLRKAKREGTLENA